MGLGLVAYRLERPLSRLEVIALKLDLSVLHRTTRTAGVLESRGERAQVIALRVESGDHCDQLSLRPPLGR